MQAENRPPGEARRKTLGAHASCVLFPGMDESYRINLKQLKNQGCLRPPGEVNRAFGSVSRFLSCPRTCSPQEEHAGCVRAQGFSPRLARRAILGLHGCASRSMHTDTFHELFLHLENRFPSVEAFLAALEPPKPAIISLSDTKAPNDFKPGDDWVYIAPGESSMGDDQSIYDDEKPAHRVRITESFWLGRHPVTNREFRLFWAAGGYKEQRFWTGESWNRLQSKGWDKPLGWDRSDINGNGQPVVGVGWFEANAYCKWLTETMALPEGFSVMLPTEAQW